MVYLWAVRPLETDVGTKHPEGSNRDILHTSLEMTIPSPWKQCQDGFSTLCQVLAPNPSEMGFMELQNGWDWGGGGLKEHPFPPPYHRQVHLPLEFNPKIQRLSLQKGLTENSQQLDSSNLEHSWTQIKAPAKRSSHLQGWLFYTEAKPQTAGTRHRGASETCNCLQEYFIFYIVILIVLLYLFNLLLYYYLWEQEENIRLMMLSQLTELCPSRQRASNDQGKFFSAHQFSIN